MSAHAEATRITPFLWFDQSAEEAVEFYLGVFPNSRRTAELRCGEAGPWPKGTILTISFELDGQRFTAMNGGPGHPFNEAVSFVVTCDSQAEIDRYWTKLTDGGSEVACGWLKDRFGISWQVVPARLSELVSTSGGMKAMMQMKKLDIAALERAAEE
jgi:predicted 3-demethylubiquinone-9 3-methyltransferase (glyoxalase superfamily)